MPAVSSASSLSWLKLLGPSVQTIFALRIRLPHHSTAQQHPKIPLLPLNGGRVVGKRLLPVAKRPRVMNAAAGAVRAGKKLMEHFVEDDELHEERGDFGS